MSASLQIIVQGLLDLQNANIQTRFQFPHLVVMGNQSAGKSSVVEELVGREFLPRGKDMVTKAPLNIRTRQIRPGSDEFVTFHDTFGGGSNNRTKFTDFNLVKQEIDERTKARVGNNKQINDSEIKMEINSPLYPDLQFVDLPGFTKNDIEDQILELVHKYIQPHNVIILAIHDATQDIDTCEALKLAKLVDPQCERTVGILTKLDKVEDGSDTDRVCRILKNKTMPLKMGYFGLVNRTTEQVDHNVSMDDSKVDRERLFNGPELAPLKARLGVDALRHFVTNLLGNAIYKELPLIKNEQKQALAAHKKALDELGLGEGKGRDPEDWISQQVEEVVKKIERDLMGKHREVDVHNKCLGVTMNELVKKGMIEASTKARTTLSVNEFYKMVKMGIKNNHAIRDDTFPEEIALEVATNILIGNYTKPIANLLDAATHHLGDGLANIVESILGAYPKFNQKVMDILLDCVDRNKLKAEEYYTVELRMHQMVFNREHKELSTCTQVLKDNGIRFTPATDVWFQERIAPPSVNIGKGGPVDEDQFDAPIMPDVDDPFADMDSDDEPATDVINHARGITKRIQNADNHEAVTKRLPINIDKEALVVVDICIQYMEVLDKQLVDKIPKLFIMQLVHNMIDYMKGGIINHSSMEKSFTSTIRSICQDVQVREALMEAEADQQRQVEYLRNSIATCEEAIRIVDNINRKLHHNTGPHRQQNHTRQQQNGIIAEA